MWTYEQTSGKLYSQSGNLVGEGYSGSGAGKNNPVYQSIKDVGPIPVGFYNIGEPFDSPDHGPFCLRLTPFAENQMFGRAGFLMHGDKIGAPGTASEGCIIQGHAIRELVHGSKDTQLEVVRVKTSV